MALAAADKTCFLKTVAVISELLQRQVDLGHSGWNHDCRLASLDCSLGALNDRWFVSRREDLEDIRLKREFVEAGNSDTFFLDMKSIGVKEVKAATTDSTASLIHLFALNKLIPWEDFRPRSD